MLMVLQRENKRGSERGMKCVFVSAQRRKTQQERQGGAREGIKTKNIAQNIHAWEGGI